MMNALKNISLFLALLPNLSLALVNMQTGGWEWSTSVVGFNLHYNSRSLYRGWFGLGWCSDLEVALEFYPLIQMSKCGQIQKIDEVLSTKDRTQIRVGDVSYEFDGDGNPVQIQKKNDLPLSLAWRKRRLERVGHSAESWSVERSPSNTRISKLSSARKTITFTYDNDQVLTIGEKHEFHYDEQGNLTLLQSQDQKVRISYAASSDRVIQVESLGACRSVYSYEELKNKKSLLLTTTVHRICGNTTVTAKQVLSQFDVLAKASAKLLTTKEVYL